jgi:hypothetical protein
MTKECQGKTTKSHLRVTNRQCAFASLPPNAWNLAQTASSPEKHALYVKMASVWFQMAQRWEKKS